ncbi:ATP synthase mitochondrial F1 complex assembly factor 2 [Olea europaea subsp. europaea]|uniref:ATP synthase mitochondrial F1 complex assembly factor 2 n=1 Tax=Olea europaea subsp. europaea TaxID=158383 RepID=A0A8S0SFF3_OLEEU|nr:ATP synthase mitochondrial F1 complex assembly factor 2 [Olea europaea subsp. europaea]
MLVVDAVECGRSGLIGLLVAGDRARTTGGFFGRKQEGLVDAIENLLKKTDDCELAAIDAIAASAHSLVIELGIFRGRLDIEQAIELIRLEEDLQVDRWGLVEGGHDVDIADLRVQISAATVFLGLSRTH